MHFFSPPGAALAVRGDHALEAGGDSFISDLDALDLFHLPAHGGLVGEDELELGLRAEHGDDDVALCGRVGPAVGLPLEVVAHVHQLVHLLVLDVRVPVEVRLVGLDLLLDLLALLADLELPLDAPHLPFERRGRVGGSALDVAGQVRALALEARLVGCVLCDQPPGDVLDRLDGQAVVGAQRCGGRHVDGDVAVVAARALAAQRVDDGVLGGDVELAEAVRHRLVVVAGRLDAGLRRSACLVGMRLGVGRAHVAGVQLALVFFCDQRWSSASVAVGAAAAGECLLHDRDLDLLFVRDQFPVEGVARVGQ